MRDDISARTAFLRGLAAPLVFALTFLAARTAAGVAYCGCLMRMVTGLPCPGCGVTTSVALLLHGRFADALRANAAGPIVVLFVAAQIVLTARVLMHSSSAAAFHRSLLVNDRILAAALAMSWLIRITKESPYGTSHLS